MIDPFTGLVLSFAIFMIPTLWWLTQIKKTDTNGYLESGFHNERGFVKT